MHIFLCFLRVFDFYIFKVFYDDVFIFAFFLKNSEIFICFYRYFNFFTKISNFPENVFV